MAAVPETANLVSKPEVIEAVTAPRSLFDLLLDYGRGSYKPEPEDIAAWVAEGYIFDERGYFTAKGLDALRENDVPLREVHVLILGQDIIHIGRNGSTRMRKGSQLAVVFGKYDKKRNSRYWDCYAGDDYPLIRVYQHAGIQFQTHEWPVGIPLTGSQFRLTS